MSLQKQKVKDMEDPKLLVVDGVLALGYYITRSGDVYSSKRGRFRKLKPRITGQSKYPQVSLYLEGFFDSYAKTVAVHRLVAENFINKVHPEISNKEWKTLSEKVKKILLRDLQVNHIDGNRENYHVSNLEWVTGESNIRHYHENRIANSI